MNRIILLLYYNTAQACDLTCRKRILLFIILLLHTYYDNNIICVRLR